MAAADPSERPEHIEETFQAITKLHADHDRLAGPLQRLVERATGLLGRPAFIGLLSAAVTLWIGLNLGKRWTGIPPWDPPPFDLLQGLATLLGLYVALMILVTQRRADQLAGQREQITLHLAILSEQKSAKIIALLEEVRRDSPALPDRHDPQASAMGVVEDPHTVLNVIKEGGVAR